MESAVAEIGSTANNYQVLAKLATGGMAEIFLARSAGVGAVQRYVVLKRVLRERASDIHFMQMFLEEARLAAQLQHANIAQVYDVGKLGDSYFFTMEYVHGETVRTALLRAHQLHRSPPIGCMLAIAAGAAAGLHHAHERIGIEGVPLGIVHRDVSPSNLMLGYDGSVKVVDFGVAQATDRIHETRSGAVKGKISYLSPEQARGQKLDRRSDLFSLGIVMWEMLTVERLYKHDSDFDTMTAIIAEPPPPPSSRRRDIPPELDRLVMRALAKSADDRFQTAEELAEAIETVAVQTSSPLSAAGISRFLRELFGTRPEPWIALQHPTETPPEVVTVTSEPIPAELRIPINDPVDRRLAAVVDLSAADAAELPAVTAPVRPPTPPPSPPPRASTPGLGPPTQSIRRPATSPPPRASTARPDALTQSIRRPATSPPPRASTARPDAAGLGPPTRSIRRPTTAPTPSGVAVRPTPVPQTPGGVAARTSVASIPLPAMEPPAWIQPPPSNRIPIILGLVSLAFAVSITIIVVVQPDEPTPAPAPHAPAGRVEVDAAAGPIVTPIEKPDPDCVADPEACRR